MTHPSFPPPPGQPEPVASSTEGLSRQLDMVVARAMVTGLCRHLDALAGVAPGSPWIIWPDGMVCGLSVEPGTVLADCSHCGRPLTTDDLFTHICGGDHP